MILNRLNRYRWADIIIFNNPCLRRIQLHSLIFLLFCGLLSFILYIHMFSWSIIRILNIRRSFNWIYHGFMQQKFVVGLFLWFWHFFFSAQSKFFICWTWESTCWNRFLIYIVIWHKNEVFVWMTWWTKSLIYLLFIVLFTICCHLILKTRSCISLYFVIIFTYLSWKHTLRPLSLTYLLLVCFQFAVIILYFFHFFLIFIKL